MRQAVKTYWRQVLGVILLLLLIFGFGSASGYFFRSKQEGTGLFQASQKDPYLRFLGEVYDKVQENYWEKISDEQLSQLFQLGAEKLTGGPKTLKPENKEGVEKMAGGILKDLEEEKKKEFTAKLADIVLVNLKPFGHSRLYTQKSEQDLENRVKNINPEVDQYEVLGAQKEAGHEQIKIAYEEKVEELEAQKVASPEAGKSGASLSSSGG